MKKRNLYILYAIALLQGMVFYAPVATLYRQAAGVGIFEISLIESISLALTVALELPWGWAADRIGYRKTMIFCCGLYFVSKIIFWQADSFWGFLLERILLSVVCSGLSGVDSSMLYLSCGEGDTHRTFSIYQNLQEIGLFAAAGIYALFVKEDYRLAGFLTAAAYGIAALLALGLQEVKKAQTEKRGSFSGSLEILCQQLRNKKLLLLVLAVSMLNETHQSITVFVNQLKYAQVGMTNLQISMAFIAVSILGLTGGFSAKLCKKLGAKRMGSWLMLVSMGCCLVLAFSPYPILCVLAVLGLRGCFSLLQPLYMDMQNRMVTTADRATALSMHAVIQDGIGIFLSLVFGGIAEADLMGAMLVGGAVCFVGFLLYCGSQRDFL